MMWGKLQPASPRSTQTHASADPSWSDHLHRAEMAKRMQTSRASLDRLLDPANDAVTLSTLQKAATALGRESRLELV